MTTEEAQKELDSIYEKIGKNELKLTGQVDARILELENIIDPQPHPEIKIWDYPLCGDPYCLGDRCWDCAAIRGGDPMDA